MEQVHVPTLMDVFSLQRCRSFSPVVACQCW